MELEKYGAVEEKKAAPGFEGEEGKQMAKELGEDNAVVIWAWRE